jgi:hypothetical protein
MQKALAAYSERAYNTIEYLCKEIIGEEAYMLEFDKVFLERGYEGDILKKVTYLMEKVRSMFDIKEKAI